MTRNRYKDLRVSVTFNKRRCEETRTFRMDASKLPQELSVEDLRVTVTLVAPAQAQDGPQPCGQDGGRDKAPVNPDRIASRGAMSLSKVEITLPDRLSADEPTWKKYKLVPVPRDVRTFFPEYKTDFIIRTPRGEFISSIASANDAETDPYRGGYISKGMSGFHKAHRDLKPGDVLVFRRDGVKDVSGQKLQVYNMTVKSP
jgi:hypothetical protein